MKIEVDQSGKIEEYVDTIVAFVNKEQYSVLLDRRVKNELIVKFRKIHKDMTYRLFAICVFYCIRDYLNRIQLIVIDLEYTGRERDIKKHLLRYILAKEQRFDKGKIIFDRIGKNSNAHRLAYQTFVGKLAPNKILTKEEIEDLI